MCLGVHVFLFVLSLDRCKHWTLEQRGCKSKELVLSESQLPRWQISAQFQTTDTVFPCVCLSKSPNIHLYQTSLLPHLQCHRFSTLASATPCSLSPGMSLVTAVKNHPSCRVASILATMEAGPAHESTAALVERQHAV